MLQPITIEYPFAPARRSLATAEIVDLFGLDDPPPPYVVVRGFQTEVHPGEVVLITGQSGSGKSSLLRAMAQQLNAADLMAFALPEQPLVEALPGTLAEKLNLLAAVGLSEARLLLRTPQELSEGQRFRFRLAWALSQQQQYLMADEFAALLDRVTAKVIAYNLRKLTTRLGVTLLCATTHDDLTEDLNPDQHIHCLGDGNVTITQQDVKKKRLASLPSYT